MIESQIKADIKSYLKDSGIYFTMVTGGAYGVTGSPDIIACVNGKFLAIEGKTYRGKQSGWQQMRQKEIEDAGGKYIIARSVTDVANAVQDLLWEDIDVIRGRGQADP